MAGSREVKVDEGGDSGLANAAEAARKGGQRRAAQVPHIEHSHELKNVLIKFLLTAILPPLDGALEQPPRLARVGAELE